MTRKYTLPKPRADALNARCMAESRLEDKFQGQPCKNGHSGVRFTKTGACIECCAKSTKSYYSKLKQRIAELEAENAELLHQHANDDAANRFLLAALEQST